MNSDEISLREYFEARWKAHEKEHEALQRAVDTAVATLDFRLSEMNQFRQQIQEERGAFMTKMESVSHHRELETKIESNAKSVSALELAKSNMDGRIWMAGALITTASGIFALLVSLAFRFWPK
jgi:ribosomal protein L16 Arg81 hydroxylase